MHKPQVDCQNINWTSRYEHLSSTSCVSYRPSFLHVYSFYRHIFLFTPFPYHLHYDITYKLYLLFHLHFIQGSAMVMFHIYISISTSPPGPVISRTTYSLHFYIIQTSYSSLMLLLIYFTGWCNNNSITKHQS